MGLLDRALSRIGFERRNDALDPSWSAIAPGIGYPGALSARAAENLSTVLACVTAVSSALAYVPALIYRREPDGNRVEAYGHPLAKIARGSANPQMTWPDWLEHVVASALLTGNGLAEIVRAGNGQLSGFRWIPWGMVTVVYLSSGRLAYDVADGRGGTRRLLEGEVIHLRDRTDDGLVGRSRLSRAADTVAGVQASNAFAKSFLDRGAQPSGVIRHPGAMTIEQKTSLREQFQERYGGAANAGRTLILDGGLE